MANKSLEKLFKACMKGGYDIINESGDVTTVYCICGATMITTDIVKLALKSVENRPESGCYVSTTFDNLAERRPALVIYWRN